MSIISVLPMFKGVNSFLALSNLFGIHEDLGPAFIFGALQCQSPSVPLSCNLGLEFMGL